MIRWNLFFEVEKVEQLALIDRLATHHDRPPSLNASGKRNHDSSISTRPFSTGSVTTGHSAMSAQMSGLRESGRRSALLRCRKSARNGLMHRSKPAPLFDHLVGGGEQRRRYGKAEHPCSLDVDDQLNGPVSKLR